MHINGYNSNFNGLDAFDDESSSSSGYESPQFTRKRTEFSEPSSENCTPSGSPIKVKTPGSTPKKAKVLMERVSEWDPEFDLTAKEFKVLDDGVAAIHSAPDTPQRKKRSQLANRLSQMVCNELFKDEDKPDIFSPEFHTVGTKRLRESSGWVTQVLAKTSDIHEASQYPIDDTPHCFIDLDHITEAKGTGFHFCPPTHPLRDKREHVCVNRNTGVMSGFYKDKFSTFFPDSIETEEELLKTILSSTVQCKSESRELRYISPAEGAGYYIETYIEATILRPSAFPLFLVEHFLVEHWFRKKEYEICEGVTISGEKVLEAIRDPRSSVRYETSDHIIYDIAQTLPSAQHIPQGIYFIVPKEAL